MSIQQQVREHINQLEQLADKEGTEFVWSEVLLEIRRKFEQRGMTNEQADMLMRRMMREAMPCL